MLKVMVECLNTGKLYTPVMCDVVDLTNWRTPIGTLGTTRYVVLN